MHELSELNSEESEKRNRIPKLYKSVSCSEIVREMEKKYHRGGYICSNCHFVIHSDLSHIDEIFDDKNMVKKVLCDKHTTLEKFKQNLIHNNKFIEDVLKPEKVSYKSIIEYLFALFKISREKQSGVTRKELLEYLGYKYYKGVIERRKFLEKYVRIIAREAGRYGETLYFLTPEGENIVRLMYYFQEYYRNLR